MIDIFNEISRRITKGVMFHAQMADYLDYLNLHGFKRWHEYQFFSESAELRGVHRYVLNHCNRLIDDGEVTATRCIPISWLNNTRLQVDTSTRKQAIKEALEKWYQWETETKEFLEKQFKKLTENSKIADANKVNELIKDVDQELKCVTRKMLEYKAVDYDMTYIMFQQDEMHEHFREKEKEIGINIC